MSDFRPRIAAAETVSDRMEALCEFIEFWAGPRLEEYGVTAEELDQHQLPMPLRKLYEFAGRWPSKQADSHRFDWAVDLFSHQDHLNTLEKVRTQENGRIRFLTENQGVWRCSTLAEGEDPPVWTDDAMEPDPVVDDSGESIVCDSLSRFLVSFVLQELVMTCFEPCPTNDKIIQAFLDSKSESIPIWENGPYVYGHDHNFYLWNNALVFGLSPSHFFFGANSSESFEFLLQFRPEVRKPKASERNWNSLKMSVLRAHGISPADVDSVTGQAHRKAN